LWEWCPPDAPAEGLWPRALRAGALVVKSAATPGARFTAPLDGSAGIRVGCCRPVEITIVPGPMPDIDDATSVVVWIRPLVYWWLVWSGRWVRSWRDYRFLSCG